MPILQCSIQIDSENVDQSQSIQPHLSSLAAVHLQKKTKTPTLSDLAFHHSVTSRMSRVPLTSATAPLTQNNYVSVASTPSHARTRESCKRDIKPMVSLSLLASKQSVSSQSHHSTLSSLAATKSAVPTLSNLIPHNSLVHQGNAGIYHASTKPSLSALATQHLSKVTTHPCQHGQTKELSSQLRITNRHSVSPILSCNMRSADRLQPLARSSAVHGEYQEGMQLLARNLEGMSAIECRSERQDDTQHGYTIPPPGFHITNDLLQKEDANICTDVDSCHQVTVCKPSLFSVTVCEEISLNSRNGKAKQSNEKTLTKLLLEFKSFSMFTFSTASPDDAVREKQTEGFHV